MSDELKPEERFFRVAIERSLGVELEHYDRLGLQNAVDFVFETPAGKIAAVEVTSIVDHKVRAWRSLMGNQISSEIACESPRHWDLYIPARLKLSSIQAHLQPVIRLCDLHGVAEPNLLIGRVDSPHLAWWINQRIDLVAHDADKLHEPGTVTLSWPPVVAFQSHAQAFAGRLAEVLERGRINDKLDKLARHPNAAERHLAIAVGAHGIDSGLVHYLANLDPMPVDDPGIEPQATHLWLYGELGESILTWSATDRWNALSLTTLRD